jgi:hypothetical protein
MQRETRFVERIPNPVAHEWIPEDVRAEQYLEARRAQGGAVLSEESEPLPEDVLAEWYMEERAARDEQIQRLAEGRPPVEEEPRS